MDAQKQPADEWDPRERMVVPMMSGASAGVAARLVCHPIDTLKAKLQVQTTSHTPMRTMFANILSKEVRAFPHLCGGDSLRG